MSDISRRGHSTDGDVSGGGFGECSREQWQPIESAEERACQSETLM